MVVGIEVIEIAGMTEGMTEDVGLQFERWIIVFKLLDFPLKPLGKISKT